MFEFEDSLKIKNVDNVAGLVEATISCENVVGKRFSETFSKRLEPGEIAHFEAHIPVYKLKTDTGSYDVKPENVVKNCPMCGGTGLVECPHCHGTGKLTCPDCDGKGTIIVTCPTCGGAGTYSGPCPTCDGTGKIYVTIPCPHCDGRGYVTNWLVVGGTVGVALAAGAGVVFALRRRYTFTRRTKKEVDT